VDHDPAAKWISTRPPLKISALMLLMLLLE
jgi:hypothetical protein